jgi:hypothetical protein
VTPGHRLPEADANLVTSKENPTMNLLRTGVAIAAFLGVLDIIAGIDGFVAEGSDKPPLAVPLIVVAVGVITLAMAPAALRRNRIAIPAIAVCRVISAFMGIGAFAAGAPAPIYAYAVATIVLGAAVLALFWLGRRDGVLASSAQ